MPNGDNSDVKTEVKFGNWATGNHCRAVFQEDGVEYEATIKSIEAEGEYCYATVRLGFNKISEILVIGLIGMFEFGCFTICPIRFG